MPPTRWIYICPVGIVIKIPNIILHRRRSPTSFFIPTHHFAIPRPPGHLPIVIPRLVWAPQKCIYIFVGKSRGTQVISSPLSSPPPPFVIPAQAGTGSIKIKTLLRTRFMRITWVPDHLPLVIPRLDRGTQVISSPLSFPRRREQGL